MFKKVLVHTRRGIKFTILFMIAAFLIVGIIAFLYKPTYSVFIKGEQVGYTGDRTKLQHKINDYVENGDGTNKNVAFVQLADLPEYKLCLLKKDIVTNDDEIFNKIKEEGTTYYRYYAIAENEEEKLYVEQPKKVTVAKTSNKTSTTNKYAATGSVNTALTTSTAKTSLGISLIRPVSGIITSRFGAGSRIRRSSHTGLDIATSTGTPIQAAASGTVTFSGYKGSYGNMIVITHSNGVQTYYGHCSKLYVSAGTTVSQGQTIAAVGSTGNSTGPHLHLEVRVNGVAYNPQNYVY